MSDDDSIEKALRQLLEAATSRDTLKSSEAKKEAHAITERLTRYAYAHGLRSQSIAAVVEIVTRPCFLDKAIIMALVDALLPRSAVMKPIVVQVVSSLGEGQQRPTYRVQALLLRWLLLISGIPHVHAALVQLYGVLFNHLRVLNLRPCICRILVNITRRKHVKPFRIQALLEVWRNAGNDPHVLQLLQLYKDFYPDILIGQLPSTRGVTYRNPDPEWIVRLSKLLGLGSQDRQGSKTSQQNFIIEALGYAGNLSTYSLRTYQVSEGSTAIEEIENVNDLVSILHRIELPNNLIVALNNHLLQILISTRGSDEQTSRLENWLQGLLSEIVHRSQSNSPNEQAASVLLKQVHSFIRTSNVVMSSVNSFLCAYIKKLSGNSEIVATFGLLSNLKLTSISELDAVYFTRLNSVFINGSSHEKALLLDFYIQLFNNWVTIHLSVRGDRLDDALISDLKAAIRYIDSLCINILEESNASVLVIDQILSFYELVVTMPIRQAFYWTTLPSDWLVYGSIFTGDAASFSRICGILSEYKRVFIAKQQVGSEDDYPRDNVDHFNGFLMDICNCLWRNRAFRRMSSNAPPTERQDTNALGCHLTDNVIQILQNVAESREEALTQLFSLSYSATLSLLATDCFREMEDRQDGLVTRHGGPVSQKSLSMLATNGGLKINFKDYKMAVLKYLEKRGFYGVCDLMYNTMVSLIAR